MDALMVMRTVVGNVLETLAHNWPYLVAGILSASFLKVYVGPERIAALLSRQTWVSVAGAVTAAVATPFCSCGTTAVVLSLLASAVPWAPIVAFMVASPLTSPDELLLSAGLFGWPFALTFFGGSIALGVAGGAVAYALERRGLLDGQARFAQAGCAEPGCAPSRGLAGRSASVAFEPAPTGVGPGAASVADFPLRGHRARLAEVGRDALGMAPRILLLFVGFAAIGYTVIALVPTDWIVGLLGGSSVTSIVIAATLGLPFYVSTEASLPLVASLMAGGMGTGPAMAFLVTGAGTSIAAVAGALLIARWRVLAVVVGTLWVGAIVLGVVAAALLS
jgi:uncharacterized membrane protein YraQ (UPF0718 family)